jgi:hypothetical protein
MKLLVPIFLCTLLLCFMQNSQAQDNDVIRIRACYDSSMHKQVDSLKKLLAKDGFVVLKEASIMMESQYEMPVIVPMNQGSWYQIIFIGDISSVRYEVRMYDYDEKQVAYEKKRWGDIDGNIISYSYIPRYSEYHMIKPVQVNNKKKKDLCGYILLMKKMKQ